MRRVASYDCSPLAPPSHPTFPYPPPASATACSHNATFLRQWLDKHVEDCGEILKKPCLVEEFGKILGR